MYRKLFIMKLIKIENKRWKKNNFIVRVLLEKQFNMRKIKEQTSEKVQNKKEYNK